jgi:hypothetical protein
VEISNHKKNGAKPKSRTSRKLIFEKMKIIIFSVTICLFSIVTYGQSSTYIVTSFLEIQGFATPNTCTSKIIVVPPTGSEVTTTSTNFFTGTSTYEKDLNDQIKAITVLGYKIVSTTTYSFGSYNSNYYIWTRYILGN